MFVCLLTVCLCPLKVQCVKYYFHYEVLLICELLTINKIKDLIGKWR